MKGSVRKRSSGSWSYRVDLGVVEGKRKQMERGGFHTKAEAVAALNEMLHQLNRTGTVTENKNITFHQVFNECVVNCPTELRSYGTKNVYKSIYENHLKSLFGPLVMYRISPLLISNFLAKKQETYSYEYVMSFYKLFCLVFSYAVKMKYLKQNTMDQVYCPKKPREAKGRRAYTMAEINTFRECIGTLRSNVAFEISLNTGARESECFALRWSDVDFKKGQIKIDKQILYQDKKWCFCPLKTANSYRTVAISENFADYLKTIRALHEIERRKYGPDYHKNKITDRRDPHSEETLVVDDLIMVKENGKMLTTVSIRYMAQKIREETGLDFVFHGLRHTYATILAENKVNPKCVQMQLGHSKVEFTLKCYTHVTDAMLREAVDTLEKALE